MKAMSGGGGSDIEADNDNTGDDKNKRAKENKDEASEESSTSPKLPNVNEIATEVYSEQWDPYSGESYKDFAYRKNSEFEHKKRDADWDYIANGEGGTWLTRWAETFERDFGSASFEEKVDFVMTITPMGGKGRQPTITEVKVALRETYSILGIEGPLPKMKPGLHGAPQRGTSRVGYRLDQGHPSHPPGTDGSVPHINYWDYSGGKRGKGGINGTINIVPFTY